MLFLNWLSELQCLKFSCSLCAFSCTSIYYCARMHAALQISLYGQVLTLCTLVIPLFCEEIYEITVLLYCWLFLQPWLQYFCLLFCSWWSSCQWGSMALLWKEFDVECWHHLCTRFRDYVQLVSQQSILLLYLFSFHEPHLWLHSEGALSVMD